MSSTLDGWPIVTPKSIFQSQKKFNVSYTTWYKSLWQGPYVPIHSKGMKKEKVVP